MTPQDIHDLTHQSGAGYLISRRPGLIQQRRFSSSRFVAADAV
jgi:hypothetical protein